MSRFAVAPLLVLVLVVCGACRAPLRPDGGQGLLPVGATAPDLVGADQSGHLHHLRAEPGTVVVYFYPKDATPGCTREACAFRDAWDRLRQGGVTVLGVSEDGAASHARFAEQHQLNFPLLADPDHVWANAFGVPLTLGMTRRVTFLLAGGRVARVYPSVDPAVHADQVLADAAALR
jgi:peroxiredoxin Q/BCP